MSKQIILHNNETELSEIEEGGFVPLKTKKQIEIELATALSKEGLDMSYASQILKKIIEEAYVINNKGDSAIDFRTKLKGIELLLKLSGFDLGQKKTQIAIFNNMPKQGEKLEF